MTPLEDRLRAEMRAESELIEPGSIPPLRLPVLSSRPLGRSRLAAPRRWPAWVTALAAAAAVIVVIAGAVAIGQAVSRPAPAPPATGGVSYSGIPRYYAYAVQGVIYSGHRTGHGVTGHGVDRYLAVRDTASGKILATVSPIAPYNEILSITGAASGRTFVFAARRDTFTKNGSEKYRQDQKRPLRFFIVRVTPGGRTRFSALSLPETLTAAQPPTLALSPDGARLAVAYGGGSHAYGGGKGTAAVVQVITLATGQIRQWTSPPSATTPVLAGLGAWTSDGRVLAVGQIVIEPNGIIRSGPTRMRLLDTAAPGTNLAASKLVTLHGDKDFSAFISPDGSTLIGTYGFAENKWPPTRESGAFGVYSARTGTLLRVVGRWHQQGRDLIDRSGRQMVAWSNPSGRRLIVEIPLAGHGQNTKIPPGVLGEVGSLDGNTFTQLRHVALTPLLKAMDYGGWLTDGGWDGFVW